VKIDFERAVKRTGWLVEAERRAKERADLEKYAMRKNPYSQTQIAKFAGVHHRTANKFFRGQPVRADAALRLEKTLEALGVVDVAPLLESQTQ
jgi:hypothetical protein